MSVDEFAGDAPARVWTVGELAAATGLTVRVLHHYGELGLVRPSLHSHAGQRRYTSADVVRLHRVTALRGFGFSLSEIAELLGVTGPGHGGAGAGHGGAGAGHGGTGPGHGGTGPGHGGTGPGHVAGLDARELVRRQLDQAQDRIVRAQRLRDRLLAVLRLLADADDPPASMLVGLIEEMTAVEHAYTPDELDQLAEHRRAMQAGLTPDQLAEMAAQRQAMRDRLSPDELAELLRSRLRHNPPG